MVDDPDTDDALLQEDLQDEQASESDMARAIAMVESGQGIEQVLESQFASLPLQVKHRIRARLQEAAQVREQREHEMARRTRDKAQGKGAKLFGLSLLAGLVSKETIEKIQLLFAQDPELARSIQQEGQRLNQRGVAMDDRRAQTPDAPALTPARDLEKEKGQSR